MQNVTPEFKLPDFSGEYRRTFKSGYIELAGLLKYIKWGDTGKGPYQLSGHAYGWGLNISTNYHLNDNSVFKGQIVYGKGIGSSLTD